MFRNICVLAALTCALALFAPCVEAQCGPDGSMGYPPGTEECPSGPPEDGPPTDDASATTGELCDGYGASTTYTETLEEDARTISTNGCPNHYSLCTGKDGVTGCGAIGTAGTATEARDTAKEKTVMANPVIASAETDVTCTLGAIGYALNGVSIYSGAVDGQCTLLDVEDDTSEWTSFDFCSGHAERTGDYHYHFAPSCLLAQMGDMASGHSPQVGWAFDGFPVYGPKGPGGIDMMPCGAAGADSTYCLDACGGLYNADDGGAMSEIDAFKYRYYFTGATSDLVTTPSTPQPAKEYYPYTFACYKGCLYDDHKSGQCTERESGVTAKYAAVAKEGATTKYEVPEGGISPTMPEAKTTPAPTPSKTQTIGKPSSTPSPTPSPTTGKPSSTPAPTPSKTQTIGKPSSTPSPTPSPTNGESSSTPSPTPSPTNGKPSSTPSPTPSPTDKDSNPSPTTSPELDDTDTVVQVVAEFKFQDLDVAEVNDAIKNAVRSSVAQGAGVPVELVQVTGVKSGSAILTTVIVFPSNDGATTFTALLEAGEAPSIFSDNADLSDKGLDPTVTYESTTSSFADAKAVLNPPTSTEDPGNNSAAHGTAGISLFLAIALPMLMMAAT